YRSEAGYLANALIGQIRLDMANLASYDDSVASAYGPRTNWRAQVAATLPGIDIAANQRVPSNAVVSRAPLAGHNPANQRRHGAAHLAAAGRNPAAPIPDRQPRVALMKNSLPARRQACMSLVELMVGMLIGLIGIVIITHVYVTNEETK